MTGTRAEAIRNTMENEHMAADRPAGTPGRGAVARSLQVAGFPVRPGQAAARDVFASVPAPTSGTGVPGGGNPPRAGERHDPGRDARLSLADPPSGRRWRTA